MLLNCTVLPFACWYHNHCLRKGMCAHLDWRRTLPLDIWSFYERALLCKSTPHLHNNIKHTRSGELRTQRLKSNLMRTHKSLKVLPLKPGVGQCIGMHATLTARDFFLANFYPSDPFTCIFSETSPDFFPFLAVANTGSCVCPPKGGRGCLMSPPPPPAVIWFHFAISSLVLLPSPVTLSVSTFSAC